MGKTNRCNLQNFKTVAIHLKKNKEIPFHTTRQTFYNYYFLTNMDYCSSIWGTSTQTAQQKVLKLQKQAARLILNIRIQDSRSKEMFSNLRWVPFHHRTLSNLAILAYKAINNNLCKLVPTLQTMQRPYIILI